MGNYRFRLSDMMPNAWFYKLKDMGKPRNHGKKIQHPISSPSSSVSHPSKPKQPHHFYPRKSYYFTRDLIPSDGFYVSRTKSAGSRVLDPPRKSSQKRSRKRNIRSSASVASAKLVSSSVSAGCRCRATLWTKTDSPLQYSASSSSDSSSLPQEFRSDCILTTRSFDNMMSLSHSSSCKAMNSEAAKDIVVVHEDHKSFVRKFDKLDGFDNLSELQLPRIITKPAEFNHKKEQYMEPTNHRRSSTKFEENNVHGSYFVKENKKTCPGKKLCVNPPGVRMRINSPKIGSRKFQGLARKSVSSSRKTLSESFAVVKSSFDPHKDFRESMVEMIRENNIRESKDLEDLLACYLSLNSDQYHGLIINVFKQIWFDLSDVRL